MKKFLFLLGITLYTFHSSGQVINAAPGPAPAIPNNCAVLALTFSLQGNASPSIICVGNSTNLYSQFYHKVGVVWSPFPLPPNSYTWSPGFLNPNLQNQVVTPLVTTTYTVRVKHGNCIFTKTITVIVVPNTVVANAGQDRAILPPTSTILGGNPAVLGGPLPSASGGTPPYAYTWIPNLNLAPNNFQPNPSAAPIITTTYSLTVTDVNGCVATDPVIVYVQTNKEYAKLLKQLDGSYYTPVNNKLYFTIDGEYSLMALNYTVYNYQRSPQPGLTLNTNNLANGDNRYEMTITSLALGYYVLEVENQKKEKLYLRFKK